MLPQYNVTDKIDYVKFMGYQWVNGGPMDHTTCVHPLNKTLILASEIYIKRGVTMYFLMTAEEILDAKEQTPVWPERIFSDEVDAFYRQWLNDWSGK